MAEEQIQYHIEIQDAQGLDAVDGEVMVVLDLNGQDLPESVAQAIMELAQNRHRSNNGASSNMKFLLQESHQLVDLPAEVAVEHIKIENIDMLDAQELQQPLKEEAKIMPQEMELEKVSVLDATTQETKTRYLVHNLAELERIRVGAAYKPRRSKQDKLTEKPLILNEVGVVKVETGVQCELIHITEMKENNSDAQGNTAEIKVQKIEPESIKGNVDAAFKHEPLWAEDGRQSSEQPAVPDEAATVPLQDKTCCHCDFTCANDLELGRHLKKTHKEKKPFVCSVCKASFELELSFQIHTLLHADAKRPVSKWKTKKKKIIPAQCVL
uniref:C2H2-type domain-containing protein n=1 Tax=Biomphalaria glabrata TaxID=6526 RepID=A0A2C9JXD2_BIOGL